MKKLFLALFAAAAIVGCSKNDVIPSVAEDGATSGLKVAFKAMTKAEEAPAYANGTVEEQAVETVTFYFFDENGGQFAVKGTDNFLSATVEDGFTSTQEGTSIEALSNVMLVIKKVDVSNFPTQMVAVINAPESVKKSMTLEELKAVDFTTLKSSDGFIMTNSVYADGSNVISTTAITADNFFEAKLNKGDEGYNAPGVYVDPKDDSYAAAAAKAVQIYVERVAAKVLVTVKESYETGATVKLVAADGTVTETEVFAKVLGWGITNNTAEAKALKVIDPAWTLTFPWNDMPNCRSYWATTTATPAHNLSFNAVKGHTTVADYYFENTLPYAENNVVTPKANNVPTPSVAGADYNQASLLLVAAQLVDAEGKALPISKWYSTYYAGEGAKVQMIGSVAHKLFVKNGEEYVSATATDVEWKQTAENVANGRYKVYPVAKEGTSYFTTEVKNGETTVVALEDANTILSTILPGQIWNTGYAYYYAPIRHYGEEIGIVRNHAYEVNVTALAGLGTPVYDPYHIITPEKPGDDEANLAAVININAWAVVNGDYEL